MSGGGSPSEQIWTGLYVVTWGPLPPVIRHTVMSSIPVAGGGSGAKRPTQKGRLPTLLATFLKNCMKLKTILRGGWRMRFGIKIKLAMVFHHFITFLQTRMHSSRMRTGRSLTRCRSLLPSRGGVLSPGGVHLVPGGVLSPRGCT